MAPKGTESALHSIFDSGAYADATIRCGTREFKIHKAIVCTQSEFFVNAFKQQAFKEGETVIITMNEDDPDIIAAALEFLYTSKYSLPADDRSTMLFHLAIYEIADMVQNWELRALAENKFTTVARAYWNKGDFPLAVQKVYAVAPPGA
ncbi:hypothetical protein EJ08DRAFT_184804 [Tothia fuscella]|uniref:BTB domain-containing protein n=1 Tax=Tothia fuscella TaxID=1048955 RepID=A0A9P4TZG0_9PEZI|nr:hypothetical protein EJ08DRAFT_184804 [Tothia fuscella]